MTSFTTLVNIDFEVPDKVATFISTKLPEEETEAFLASSREFIEKKQTQNFIDLLLSKVDIVLALANDQEVDAVFQSMFSVLYVLTDEQSGESPSIISSIIKTISSDSSNATRRRLNALVILFNLVFSSQNKLELLLAIYSYSLRSNQLAKINHFHDKLGEWVEMWQLNEDEQQRLYSTVASILFEADLKKKGLEQTVAYLRSLDSAISTADADRLVKPALLYAIHSPLMDFKSRASLFDVLGLQRLPAPLMPLVSLLRVLCDGSVADLAKFSAVSENAKVLEEHGVSLAVLERKVKLLSLTSLAAESSSRVISFSAIASALQISENDVEEWVVDAVGEGLLGAAIDQISSTVSITRFVQRSFGPAQWRNLGNKLEDLKSRLEIAVTKLDSNAVV